MISIPTGHQHHTSRTRHHGCLASSVVAALFLLTSERQHCGSAGPRGPCHGVAVAAAAASKPPFAIHSRRDDPRKHRLDQLLVPPVGERYNDKRSAASLVLLLSRGGSSSYHPTNPSLPSEVPPLHSDVTGDDGSSSSSSLPPYHRRADGWIDDGNNNPSSSFVPPSHNPAEEQRVDEMFQETVQDRVDSWRQAQLAQASRLQESPRDDQGRLKLLTGVSRGSRAIIFVCLVFRNLHLFEVADQRLSKGGIFRLLVVTPLIALFVANLAGVVASFSAPSHSAKKRLKAILNLDKLLEACLIVWNVGRLTLAPSPYVPREIYVSSALHSAFFILQCQAFTRLTWDENAAGGALSPQQPQQQQPLASDPSTSPLPVGDEEEWYYGNGYQRLGNPDNDDDAYGPSPVYGSLSPSR